MEYIELHADFTRRVVVKSCELPWAGSSEAGVERKMLERIGGEVARATSIVRYLPNSHFPAHRHDLGEEFLVLEGVFSDEHGHYPRCTYVRNPPGSRHTPFSNEGCIIFVKLRQMDISIKERVIIHTPKEYWSDLKNDIKTRLLFEDAQEHAALMMLPPYTRFLAPPSTTGEEILILEGTLYDAEEDYPAGTWMRSLHTQKLEYFTKDAPTCFFIKTGHLHAMLAR